jgi:hypothetical protein
MMPDDKTEPDTSYDVPDRSLSVSPEDLSGVKPCTIACPECEVEMSTTSGSESVECDCGHSWKVDCFPAEDMDALEKSR